MITLLFIGWLSDQVSLNGERTVYTVECQDGPWEGSSCTGKLMIGNRYRFRILKEQREVLFWTAGNTTEPSGKFSDCEIIDGRNWRCNPDADAAHTIAHEMQHGHPVRDASGQPHSFHPVSKLRWFLIKYYIPTGTNVDEI
jgi:hypothetical protein